MLLQEALIKGKEEICIDLMSPSLWSTQFPASLFVLKKPAPFEFLCWEKLTLLICLFLLQASSLAKKDG